MCCLCDVRSPFAKFAEHIRLVKTVCRNIYVFRCQMLHVPLLRRHAHVQSFIEAHVSIGLFAEALVLKKRTQQQLILMQIRCCKVVDIPALKNMCTQPRVRP